MKAQIFPLFFFFFFLFFTTSQSFSCPPIKCNPQGPEIHYPFRETTHHHPHCGRAGPGFDLTCHHNTTTIGFHSSTSSIDLLVKSIDYVDSRVDLLDPRGCVHGVFMDLNLTGTPFEYAYKVEDFMYLNCSTRVAGFDEVGCLSGAESHVYTVEKGSDDVEKFDFCKEMKTVAIPIGYSPYLADDGFGLGLIWTVDGGDEMGKGLSTNNCIGREILCSKWLKLAFCIVLAALIVSIKMYCHTNRVEQQLEEIGRSRPLVDHSLKRRQGV